MNELGAMVRQSRIDANLSQVELAERAGTSQPTLARYESGGTLPTLPTLERLLTACGRQIRIEAPRLGEAAVQAGSIRGQLGPHAERLRRRRHVLLQAAHRHGVSKLRVFGSVARGEAGLRSDIDFLVDLRPGRTLVDLAGFRREAQEIIGLPVDVATPDMLKEHLRSAVLSEALPL